MLSNDRGFSLVQVLISSGLLGAAALVGIKMMANQERMAKSISQKYEMSYIHEEIWRVLQDMDSCEATFAGKTIEEISSGKSTTYIVKNYSREDKAQSTQLYKVFKSDADYYGVKNLKISSYSAQQRVSSIEPIFDFSITFDKGKNSIGGQFITKTVPIVFSTENGKLSNCNALSITPQDSVESKAKKMDRVVLKGPVGINRPPVKSLSLALSGPIFFDVEFDRPKCDFKASGMITYDGNSENLFFCAGDSTWKPFGPNVLDWSRPTRVVAQTSTNTPQTIGEFKLCTLNEVTEVNHKACILKNRGPDLINPVKWELSPSQGEPGSCTFLCFN